jgi:hypothetical protein
VNKCFHPAGALQVGVGHHLRRQLRRGRSQGGVQVIISNKIIFILNLFLQIKKFSDGFCLYFALISTAGMQVKYCNLKIILTPCILAGIRTQDCYYTYP